MWRCVTGKQNPGHFGCLLADEMGLGKTVQCIALIDALLRLNKNGGYVINKALIIAPTGLLRQWASEFEQWLGGDIKTEVIDGTVGKNVAKTQICKFIYTINGKYNSLLPFGC